MRQPHFMKYAQSREQRKGAASQASAEPDGDQGEVVIRADAIFLGSSYPHRLRVVCFEGPAIGLNRFTAR